MSSWKDHDDRVQRHGGCCLPDMQLREGVLPPTGVQPSVRRRVCRLSKLLCKLLPVQGLHNDCGHGMQALFKLWCKPV